MYLYTMVVAQVVFAIVTIILAFAQCQPTRKLWEKNTPGICWSPNVLNYFSYWFCAYTTVTDLVLAVIPVTAFWQLVSVNVRSACETNTNFLPSTLAADAKVHKDWAMRHDEHNFIVGDCNHRERLVPTFIYGRRGSTSVSYLNTSRHGVLTRSSI
jgi:hypothetical protein